MCVSGVRGRILGRELLPLLSHLQLHEQPMMAGPRPLSQRVGSKVYLTSAEQEAS